MDNEIRVLGPHIDCNARICNVYADGHVVNEKRDLLSTENYAVFLSMNSDQKESLMNLLMENFFVNKTFNLKYFLDGYLRAINTLTKE